MKRAYIFILTVVFLFGLSATAFAGDKEVYTEAVDYSSSDGVLLKGYLAYDPAIKGKRPGVLVVHEWWGHNDYARKRARMLASMGYTALAVDMYGDGKVADHPGDAGKFAGQIRADQALGRARFMAAMEVLKANSTVDQERIAAIGYCFGGSLVLHMARSGIDLKGVASFHGGLSSSSTDKPGAITAKLFVAHGGADAFEPPEHITKFKAEMMDEGADLLFITYEGASHSFTNPDADIFAEKFNLPLAYNEVADKKSWQELKGFLEKVFRGE